ADRLGWRRRAVENSWLEIETLGMAEADWSHGVIWMPQGIRHNPPENPNVIRGWSKQVLPECPLMVEALITLHSYIQAHLTPLHLEAFREGFWEGLRKGFPKGFGEGFREPFGEPFPEPCPKQEQEQDLREEYTPPVPPPRGGGARPSLRKPTTAERRWAESFRQAHGC